MAFRFFPSWCKSFKIVLCLTISLFLAALPNYRIESSDLSPNTKALSGFLSQITTPSTLYLPSVMRIYPPPPPIFGVVMSQISTTGGLGQALNAGAYWADFNAFSWPAIEPVRTSSPTYHWEMVDEQSLINASQEELAVVARVHFTPTWAREFPEYSCSRIKRDSFDEFAQFLTALVKRYKEPPYNVKYWQLDSEVDVDPSLTSPDNPVGFWCWGDQSDYYYGGAYFAEMLKWAYPAIKAADPWAQVVVGGLLLDCDPRTPPPGKNCQPARFLEGILRGGGGPYFDIVSFHGYAYYGGVLGRMSNGNWTGGDWSVQSAVVKEKSAFVRQVLDAYGYKSKSMMNLEAALMCLEGSNLNDCFETQAMYIPRAYAEALAYGVMAQAWFLMKEPVWRSTGLLYQDLTPKPVYYAYSTAARFLTDVQYVGQVNGYSGIQGYAFLKQDGKTRIEVVWSADNASHSLTVPQGSVIYDKYGNILGGSVIQVGYSPVYIEKQ